MSRFICLSFPFADFDSFDKGNRQYPAGVEEGSQNHRGRSEDGPPAPLRSHRLSPIAPGKQTRPCRCVCKLCLYAGKLTRVLFSLSAHSTAQSVNCVGPDDLKQRRSLGQRRRYEHIFHW
jgi:hypothetical protein